MSQAFPCEAVLSVKGDSLAKDIAADCQEPNLPAVKKGCTSRTKGIWTGATPASSIITFFDPKTSNLIQVFLTLTSCIESNSLLVQFSAATKPAA